ncbi:MAG: hypothetical protein KME31_18645 [Tolypothrix carrinoi HA7290-LM1]|nr:hypothetical protein [Tolypothrix carrinoi HA7290-LM1]
MGIGHWAMVIKEATVSDAGSNTILSMPHDGRCFMPGNPSTALPPHCPMPIAPCPMPNSQFPNRILW